MTKFLQSKILLRVSLALAIGNVLFMGVRGCSHELGFTTINTPFDARIWGQPTPKTGMIEERRGMWDDLRANHLRLGMTKAQILELLGKPNDIKGQTFVCKLGWKIQTICKASFDFDDKGRLKQIRRNWK